MGVYSDSPVYVLRNFQNYIIDIRTNPLKKNKHHEGYLVNYDDYKDFESSVDKLISQQQNQNIYFGQTMNNNNNANNIEPKKCKTESLNNVLSLIEKDYKFIIINKDTYKSICEQIEQEKEFHKIKYYISNGMLYLYREKGKEVTFKDNNNIIEKTSLVENKANNINDNNNENSINDFRKYEQNFENIYTDINNYYKN